MSLPDTQSAFELASELRPALLRILRVLRHQRSDATVTLTQMSALGALYLNGPMSAGELAAWERVQPPSMTKVIAGLEERGLLRREAHPTDRRQAIIVLTEEGETLLAEERRSRDRWLAKALTELSDDERARLRDAVPILTKLSALDR